MPNCPKSQKQAVIFLFKNSLNNKIEELNKENVQSNSQPMVDDEEK